LFDDIDENGVSYHPTVRPEEWWAAKFIENGLRVTDNHSFAIQDFCRGTGNGIYDWDVTREPEKGFHFVARCA
jgi:hypothetical protein